MKFVKTCDGWYVDQTKIDSFSILEKNKPKCFAVVCFIDTQRYCLKEYKRKIDAQAWLDEFVGKLNAEK